MSFWMLCRQVLKLYSQVYKDKNREPLYSWGILLQESEEETMSERDDVTIGDIVRKALFQRYFSRV